jgi:Lipopolysaccharide-assembly
VRPTVTRSRWARSSAIAALALASHAGCGYTLVRQGQLPGGGAIAVESFRNNTAQAEAGGLFTAAAREQLGIRGRLAAEGDPDAPLLSGELVALRSSTSALGAAGAAVFRLAAELRVRVHRGPTTLYEETAGGSEDYLQAVDVLGTEANRRAALRRLADSVLRDVLERMEAASLPR